jgi:hypothetical protein
MTISDDRMCIRRSSLLCSFQVISVSDTETRTLVSVTIYLIFRRFFFLVEVAVKNVDNSKSFPYANNVYIKVSVLPDTLIVYNTVLVYGILRVAQ